MSARTKPNAAYVNDCLLLSSLIGLMSSSLGIGMLAFVAMLAACLAGGEIRPARRRR
ncbi:hypothetical protein EP7_000969 [Isosphaeraceae bacterium EP7]